MVAYDVAVVHHSHRFWTTRSRTPPTSVKSSSFTEIDHVRRFVGLPSPLTVRAKDTINQLKEEISNLSKLVEKGAGLSVGQENMVKELIRVRDELTRKTDEQGQTIGVS